MFFASLGVGTTLEQSRFICTDQNTLPHVEFADPPPNCPPTPLLPVTRSSGVSEQKTDEPVVPMLDPPNTLVQWAVLILNTPNPTLKVAFDIPYFRNSNGSSRSSALGMQ